MMIDIPTGDKTFWSTGKVPKWPRQRVGAGFGVPGASEARWGREWKPDSGRRKAGFRGPLRCRCLLCTPPPPTPPPAQDSQPRGKVPGLRACGGGVVRASETWGQSRNIRGALQEIIPARPVLDRRPARKRLGLQGLHVTSCHSPSGTWHMGEKPKPGGPSPVTDLSQLGRSCRTDSP